MSKNKNVFIVTHAFSLAVTCSIALTGMLWVVRRSVIALGAYSPADVCMMSCPLHVSDSVSVVTRDPSLV